MKDLWLSLVLMIALWAESPAAELWADRFLDWHRMVTLHIAVDPGTLNGEVIFKMLRFEIKLVTRMKKVE